MLTNEARSHLRRDTQILFSRAGSPPDPALIGRTIVSLILRRMQVRCPSSVVFGARQAVSARLSAQSHSDLLSRRVALLLGALRGQVESEIEAGILAYAIGDDRQHGLAIVGIQILDEASGLEAARRLVSYRAGRISDHESADRGLLGQINALPPQIRRLVLGALDEARLHLGEGDESSAASFFATARRLIRSGPARIERP